MINLKDAVTDNGIEIVEFKKEAIKTNARLDSIEGQQEITNKRLDSIDFKIDNTNKENKEKIVLLEVRTNKIERHLNLA